MAQTDRYEDCDECGERYWDDAIDAYLVEITRPNDDVVMVCRKHALVGKLDWWDIHEDEVMEKRAIERMERREGL